MSILAEPPVAIVDKTVDKRGTRGVAQAYLEYLYGEDGQDIAAKHSYGRGWQGASKRAGDFPKVSLFPIDEVFGGWQGPAQALRRRGIFDEIYQPK